MAESLAESLPDIILATIRKRVGRTRQVAKDKGQVLTQAEIDRGYLLAEVDMLRKELGREQRIATDAEPDTPRGQGVDRARVRDLLASMRAAMEGGDTDTVAMNIGQLAHHVAEEADCG